MNYRFRIFGLCLAVLTFGIPGLLHAQAVGEIWGLVTDQSDAVIPKANLTAINTATGLTYSTVSTGAGNYSLTNVPIGTYTISAGASGFKTGTTASITLRVVERREVNFILAVAGTAQSVTVSAAPPLLNTSSGALGSVVVGNTVSTLPLNGRDITNLIEIQPGVGADPNGPPAHGVGTGGWLVSDGTRGQAAIAYMDGVDMSDAEYGGPSMTNFNLDAVAEFRIQQNDYSAEDGRGGGMVIQLASKAGTNAFHGSLFEFVRNSDFDSRSFFANEVPPLQRNEFGGTVGGPIIKNKEFFFFEYAGFRQLSGTPNFYLFPTAQNRQGIVDITGANGQPDQLTVPLNSVAQTVLNKYPLPNDPLGPYGPNTFLSALKTPLDENQFSARIDHHFSEKDSLFGRFTYSNNFRPLNTLSIAAIDPAWSDSYVWDARSLAISETHIFTPTLVSTLKVGWNRVEEGDIISSVKNLVSMGTNDGSLSGWGPIGTGYHHIPDTGLLNGTIHWVRGRNTMSMGIEYRESHSTESGPSDSSFSGSYLFGTGTPIPVNVPSASGLNNLPAGSPSPSGLVSLMLGIPISYSRSLPFPGFASPGGGYCPFQIRQWSVNGWFQDNVVVTRKLALNIGLRYEYNAPITEEHDRLASIVDNPHFAGGSIYRAMVLNPTPAFEPDYHGIGPRLGLAYRLSDKTVLRGGFGIFTLIPRLAGTFQEGGNFPFAGVGTRINPVFQLTPIPVPSHGQLTDLAGNPMPPNNNTNLIPPNTPLNLAPAVAYYGGPVETNLISMEARNGYVENANVTIERQLPGDMVLSIRYIASNGVKLSGDSEPNAYAGASAQYAPFTDAYPGIGEFFLEDSHEHSTYNALQVEFLKTSPKYGLTFQGSYTWSKELDDGDTVYNGGQDSLISQQDPFCWRCDKGPGTISFPHDFVMNFVYSLPFAKSQALSHLPTRLTEGWQVAAIPKVISGAPFTVYSPFPVAGFGIDNYYGTVPTRPDGVGQVTLNDPSKYNTTLSYFAPGVVQDGTTLGQQIFATPGGQATGFQAHPGNLGRDTFRAPLESNVDFSIIKNTKLTESKALQFRAEFFNLFNLHAFGVPGETLGVAGFGLFSGSTPGRVIQFGLRLVF